MTKALPPRQPEYSPYYGHSSAVEFERNNKLRGITRSYRLSDGKSSISPGRLERWVDDLLYPLGDSRPAEPLRRLNKMAGKIVRINPELAIVPRVPEDRGSEEALLRGIAYRYNPSDIAFFMHRKTAVSPNAPEGENMRQLSLDIDLDKRLTAAGEVLKRKNGIYHPPGSRWRPSPATVSLVETMANEPSRAPAKRPPAPRG